MINQNDHVTVDKCHAFDILEVNSSNGAHGDSDHYLVRVNYRHIDKTGEIKTKNTQHTTKGLAY